MHHTSWTLTSPFCHITVAISERKVLTMSIGFDERYTPMVKSGVNVKVLTLSIMS